MVFCIRTLLIWLLVLAVPFQTATAASMAMCGPGQQTTAADESAAPTTAHVHTGDQVHGGHDHHASPAQATEAVDASAAGASTPTSVMPADAQTCSVCASCCSGTAMLGSTPKVVPPEFGSVAFVSLLPPIAFVAATGPDRPPRGTHA